MLTLSILGERCAWEEITSDRKRDWEGELLTACSFEDSKQALFSQQPFPLCIHIYSCHFECHRYARDVHLYISSPDSNPSPTTKLE